MTNIEFLKELNSRAFKQVSYNGVAINCGSNGISVVTSIHMSVAELKHLIKIIDSEDNFRLAFSILRIAKFNGKKSKVFKELWNKSFYQNVNKFYQSE